MNTRFQPYIAFILLLLSSSTYKSYACYFYPYGDDIRMSLFYPESFDFHSYERFNYCYSYEYPSTNDYALSENVELWYIYCHQKVSKKAIGYTLDELDFTDKKSFAASPLIQYLKRIGDQQALDYLAFAKAIEAFNPDANDAWEHNQDLEKKKINELITIGFNRIHLLSNKLLIKRYYFQIFRMLHYNSANKKIIELYDQTYSKQFHSHDLIDNWVLFYRMSAEPNNAKMNYYASQLFGVETDNRFDIRWYFNRHIPINQVMHYAKTNTEKANIIALYSIRRLDYNLNVLHSIYAIHPQNEALEFLVLREINKIEDWVLTPTYTMFLPVLREDYWENSNGKRLLNRVDVDRKYAEKVLDFVQHVNLKKVKNPNFWRLSQAYLEFLIQKPAQALSTLSKISMVNETTPFKEQYFRIYALATVANQPQNNAIIPQKLQEILLANKENGRFLFAIAKELEFLGNKSEAALLISKIVDVDQWEGNVYWRSSSGKSTLWDDFNFNWYHYVDAELNAEDWEKVVLQMNLPQQNSFQKWLVSTVQKDKNRVYDLLGIKYMRLDNLAQACIAFEKVAKGYYTNNPLFNENPFYKIKGYMYFDEKKPFKNLTKAKVVHQMIQLRKSADKKGNKRRHKDYFLLANCYYNQTYYGNAWMFNRISRTEYKDRNYPDEANYYSCQRARYYYEKALQYALSTDFKALCEYMISKCKAREAEQQFYSAHQDEYFYDSSMIDAKINERAFRNFQEKYPDHYEEMMSNCEIFAYYYKQ
ncbi:MAG: hypothetical protein RLZZ500_660 [Bacteroidota bacterium]